MKAAIYILAFILIGPLYGQKKTIVTVQAPKVADDPRPKYFKLLLELALEKTVPEYGPFEIQVSKTMSSQGRDIKLLQSKVLDVTWTMSSIEREKVVEPVRFPLLMGLFGYRVCLVHKDNRDLFAKIKSLQDWKASQFTIGQGHDWPDTNILRANGLSVETSAKYRPIFDMLRLKRIDCFARAIPEYHQEIKAYGKGQLIVEPHIIFRYKTPLYFFLNKDNKPLRERIFLGLEKAKRDGSFQKLFDSYHGKALKDLNLEKRTIIDLNNPYIPSLTPLKRKDLWFEVESSKG